MLISPMGFFAASGGAAAGAYELISTTVLGADTASVTFSSIDQTYKHLELRIVGRNNDSGGTQNNLRMTVNGSSTGYAYHRLGGNGSSVTSIAATSATQFYVGALPTNAQTSQSGAAVISILDYASVSKNKTIRSFFGASASDASTVGLYSGLWTSTSAITSILLLTSGSFVAGSRFSLYGIKG